MTRWCWLVPCCLWLLEGGATMVGARPPAEGQKAESAKAEISRVVRTSIDWALAKDTQALYNCLARDSTLFIFHPDSKSTIVGFDAFRKMAEADFLDPRFRATDSKFKDLRIHLSPSGDVAWFSCLLDDHGEWDGRKTGWDDARWTGVLEKRAGRWAIVQMHFSLASDEVEAAARGGGRFSLLTGPYLGQKLPGATPAVFAPGLVCTGMSERDVAITADGREIYFGVLSGRVTTIMVSRLENDHWTEPQVASFASDLRYFHLEPCLSADGKRVLFLSTRPTVGEQVRPGWANQNIFAADRRDDGSWGEPYDLGVPVNTAANEFFPSLTKDGTLYFTRSRPGEGAPVIVRSRWVNGRYQEPDTLPGAVNGKGAPYNAFISPAEDYLIACVDGRSDGPEPGRSQYFIFFRDAGDRWREGICLGPEVSPASGNAGSPYVSPDGRCFFFGSAKTRELTPTPGQPLMLRALRDANSRTRNGNSDIYWMDASFLDSLRTRGTEP
jgi:ketosteroid isomerase-like protein